MTKHAAATRSPRRAAPAHRHGGGRCLNILRALSDYLDDDLSQDICKQIRQHLGACPNCEQFVTSLRQTIAFCRHRPVPILSKSERLRMREEILKQARSR